MPPPGSYSPPVSVLIQDSPLKWRISWRKGCWSRRRRISHYVGSRFPYRFPYRSLVPRRDYLERYQDHDSSFLPKNHPPSTLEIMLQQPELTLQQDPPDHSPHPPPTR